MVLFEKVYPCYSLFKSLNNSIIQDRFLNNYNLYYLNFFKNPYGYRKEHLLIFQIFYGYLKVAVLKKNQR